MKNEKALYELSDEHFNYFVHKFDREFFIMHEKNNPRTGEYTILNIPGILSNNWHVHIEVGERKKERMYERGISLTKMELELLIKELSARCALMSYHPKDLKAKIK